MANKEIKFSILFVSLLLVIIFILDRVIEFGVKHSNKGQLGKINVLCDKSLQPEIAVFGSSVGEVGISSSTLTRKTGLTAFNFSIDGTPFTQYEGLVREFNSQNENTKIVVFAETYFTFSPKHSLTALERYLAHISNKNVYESLFKIQPNLVWKCKNIPFYKYVTVSHTYYLNAWDGYKSYFSKQIPSDSQMGQVPVIRNWESDADENLKKIKPFKIEIDSSIVEQYNFVLKRLNEKNRKVVIVLMPTFIEVSNKLTDFSPIREILSQLSENKKNIYFLDYSKSSICLNKSLFYNSNHLNSIGANYFSSMLADTIITLNKL